MPACCCLLAQHCLLLLSLACACPAPPVLQWVAELFSSVPGGRGPRPQYSDAGMPFQGGRFYLLPAVRDDHRLTVTFQLPCLNGKYRWAGWLGGCAGCECGLWVN
jgi:hypothetical protein